MTRTEVMQLEGRELNAAVAERVMEYVWVHWDDPSGRFNQLTDPHLADTLLEGSFWKDDRISGVEEKYHVPNFSGDIIDAWEIVNKLAPLFGDVDKGDGWFQLNYSDAAMPGCDLDQFTTWEPVYDSVDNLHDETIEIYTDLHGPPEDGKIQVGRDQVQKWTAHFHPMHAGHVDSVHDIIDTSKCACALGRTAPEAIARAAVMSTIDREPYYE